MTPELLAWADLVLVMERAQRARLSQKFRTHLDGVRVACLDIRDDYDFMDPSLVELLLERVPPYLPRR